MRDTLNADSILRPSRHVRATITEHGGMLLDLRERRGRWATEHAALGAIASCQQAARWYPGRAACLENSLAAFIALALRGYRADWCIGCRLGPAEAHAWIETPAGPAGEPDRPGRTLHATVRI